MTFKLPDSKFWYYYLNNPDKDKTLLNCEIIGPNSLVVQYEKSEGTRLYTVFKNYVEYLKYISTIPPSLRHFSELILNNNLCKPYFDIDGPYIEHEIDRLIFLDKFLTTIVNVVKNLGNTIDVTNQIMVFDSSGKYPADDILECDEEAKTSYHIVVQGICNNTHYVKELAKLIYNELPSSVRDCLDLGVYSSNHGMRMMNNCKARSKRIKTFLPSFLLNGEQVFTDIDVLDIDDEEITIFEKSLITCIYGNPGILTPEPPSKSKEYTIDTVDGIDIDDFSHKLNAVVSGLDIIKGQGSFIFLDNKNGYYCPFCRRDHENENPYVLVKDDGALYFSCRRNPKNQLCYIGVLDNYIVDKKDEKDADIKVEDAVKSVDVDSSISTDPVIITKQKETIDIVVPRLRGRNKHKTINNSSQNDISVPSRSKNDDISVPSKSKNDDISVPSRSKNDDISVPSRSKHSMVDTDKIYRPDRDGIMHVPKSGKSMIKKTIKRQNVELNRRYELDRNDRLMKNVVETASFYNTRIPKKEKSASECAPLVEAMRSCRSSKSKNMKDRSNKDTHETRNVEEITNYMALPPNYGFKNKQYESVINLHSVRKNK